MRNPGQYIGLATGLIFLTSLFLAAGCSSHDEGTETDKEAVKNAAKAPTRATAPGGAAKSAIQPPPP